jgi:SpoVK/Ycf46/Vps4 family AAA+-type ATPase
MAGVQYADLNLAKITDKWVGSSERNLEKAFTSIRALAPCLVVIDEIDQLGFSRETGDGTGVSSRLFRRLLEFMSDPKIKGQVVFVGITNRPDLLDAALKRPGRFDKKIPILAPGLEQRIEIIKAIFNRYKIKYTLTDEQLSRIAGDTDGYTGAELEALALKMAEVAEDAGREAVEMDDAEYANKVYRPTTQDIEKMTRLALDECNDLDLLPPEWKEKMLKEKPKRSVSYVPRARRG